MSKTRPFRFITIQYNTIQYKEENAKLFLDYVGSKEVQEILATKFNIRGVRTDVALPKGLGPIADIKLLDYDFDWASRSKKDIVTRWKNIVSGKE